MTTSIQSKSLIPFCANYAPELLCPKCGEDSVHVREKATYFDGDECEAYCTACAAALRTQVAVVVEFSQPEAEDE